MPCVNICPFLFLLLVFLSELGVSFNNHGHGTKNSILDMQFQFQTTMPKLPHTRVSPKQLDPIWGRDTSILQLFMWLVGVPEKTESKQCVKLESHGRIWAQKQRACRRRRWRDSGHFPHLCGISLDFGVDKNARHACYGLPTCHVVSLLNFGKNCFKRKQFFVKK